MSRKTRFISVEVVMKTDGPHEAFVQWFTARGEHVSVVPCDTQRHHIYFAPLPCGSAEETIQRLCQLIDDLPALQRQQWDAAGFREFFVGYDVGDEPFCYDGHFSRETLLSVTALGAGIGLALYASRDKHAA